MRNLLGAVMKNANVKQLTKQALTIALVISQTVQASSAGKQPLNTDASRDEIAAFKREVREDGRFLNKVLLMFTRDWNKILARRGRPGGPDENVDMNTLSDLDKNVYVRPPSKEEMRIARETKDLANKYYQGQGVSRYLGSFIESGAPWSDGYQWDTHRWQGLRIPAIRNKILDKAAAEKIPNIRFGINTHDINLKRPETADAVVDMCVEMWKRGITPTISVLFFPSLKNLRTFDKNGKVVPELSYQNHPDFQNGCR